MNSARWRLTCLLDTKLVPITNDTVEPLVLSQFLRVLYNFIVLVLVTNTHTMFALVTRLERRGKN